jgi:glycosyltransferase involved in cell wall biosynthesis
MHLDLVATPDCLLPLRKKDKRVLVLGNYAADDQQSMIRFAQLLVSIYQSHAQVRLIQPPVLTARLPGLPHLARKYIAYIDKLLLFPLWLTLLGRSFDLVHVADHSNAFYAFFVPRWKSLVTCHDLLAVRGAMGDRSTACEASPIGIWLQRLILAGLGRAGAVAFDSQASYQDFKTLLGNPPRQRHAVIPIPLNAPFSADTDGFPLTSADQCLLPHKPFLLMVGSAHPRKNRLLALRLIEQLGPESPYRIVFAGAPFTEDEQNFRDTHPLGERLLSIEGPSHALLNHLYCGAHALLFPSFAEGFGWPLVEAQTCRCPVIASATTSIPEVAGDGALYAKPTDVAAFAAHVHSLEHSEERARMIELGINNINRYDPNVVGETYRRFAFHA